MNKAEARAYCVKVVAQYIWQEENVIALVGEYKEDMLKLSEALEALGYLEPSSRVKRCALTVGK